MTREESIKQLRNNLERSSGKSKRLGGQQCGLEILPIILKSEELGVEISVNHFKQHHKNLEYAKMLFDLIIEDLV